MKKLFAMTFLATFSLSAMNKSEEKQVLNVAVVAAQSNIRPAQHSFLPVRPPFQKAPLDGVNPREDQSHLFLSKKTKQENNQKNTDS